MILLLIFGVLAITGIHGQTYYYECYESADKNGTKTKESGGGYLTFIAQRKQCYLSDKDGYKKDTSGQKSGKEWLLANPINPLGSSNYCYIKSQDGTLVFDDSYTMSFMGYSQTQPATKYLYFSSDYSKMILRRLASPMFGIEERVYMFIKTNGPYDKDIPVF